jgi:tetratricopeptide (TPR) repeat protein
MGFYLQKNGGDALITRNHNDFKVNLFSMGTEFSELVETKGCFESLLENTGPDEYCYMFDEYFASAYRFNLRGLLSFLRFSYWDPDAYAAVHERMVELFSAADVAMKEEIKRDLEKVRNNIYRINIGHDVYNYLGIFYQKQKDFPKALELYLQSLTVFGDKTAPHNNIALIYEQEKNYAKALDHYQKSYALDKKNAFAHKKIYQLTGRPFMAASGTIVKAIFVAVVLFGIIYYIQK